MMKMFSPRQLLRPHLRKLVPYSSARDDYQGDTGVFLDANENPLGSITAEDWNRYPDPYQTGLKKRIGEIQEISEERIFLGNGSDESIDLLFRAFCEPERDNVVTNVPTYGMYQVSADIHNIAVKQVLLDEHFDLDVNAVLEGVDEHTKLVFICSPNNPTGNLLSIDRIESVLQAIKGIVVIDEAYIDFANQPSFIKKLDDYPNMVVLQTFSKAWGLAALRLGIAFSSREILGVLNMIKAPYNLSALVQEVALNAMENPEEKDAMVSKILISKEKLKTELEGLSRIEHVYASDANFFLVKVKDAKMVYQQLRAQKIIVRDRSGVVGCEDCLRITIGTEEENTRLIAGLKQIKK